VRSDLEKKDNLIYSIAMSDKEYQDNSADEERISWHPAFFEAIQMELDEYSEYLEFVSEYQLTTEPLRIDVAIIKKSRDVEIKKNIAAIFRKENIVEYKSPDDYVSVDDFDLVYAYALLYKSINKLDIRDLTVTFVESRYPREVIEYLENVRGYTVEEKWPGIYYVRRDIIPIQIIDSRRLSADENIWLKDLDNRLGAAEMREITAEALRRGKVARIKAYFDVIMRANREIFEEVARMSGNAKSLDKILEETGFVARWEARGEARGAEKKAAEIANNLLKKGFSVEQTAELSGLDEIKIKAMSE
jgi:hypothetical protein